MSDNLQKNKVKYSTEYTPIKEWREDDRPRERLIKFGADSLSDSEILAILIGHGTVGKSAVDIARDLLNVFSNLTEMAKCDVAQFSKINGIGTAKAVIIAAAFELSRRIVPLPVAGKVKLLTPLDIADYFIPKLRDLRTETFRILLVNTSMQIIKEIIISDGILNQTLVHPREVFRPAIVESAAGIFLVHNHPSGNTNPSQADKIITQRLIKTGETIGIVVFDHIIIGNNNYCSMKESGYFNF